MHGIAIVLAILGGLALVGAWIAGESGTALGFSQEHLYNDAIVLTLLSISGILCAAFYLKQEKNQ